MPGPPPKPPEERRRRNLPPEGLKLPAAGRQGDLPKWPMGRGVKAELEIWGELWGSPQAVAWESLGWFRVVARYCRLLVAAEKRDAPAALLAEVRQLEDRLGLSPMAMKRLQWSIVAEDGTPAAATTPSRYAHLAVVTDAVERAG